jgi:hypothetical protein
MWYRRLDEDERAGNQTESDFGAYSREIRPFRLRYRPIRAQMCDRDQNCLLAHDLKLFTAPLETLGGRSLARRIPQPRPTSGFSFMVSLIELMFTATLPSTPRLRHINPTGAG